ncbi:hypothetical protein BGZ73_009011 [Actinomortierella ambigua]|nr:hypothetical protein BGZ73_009011 [Actinomortierella ambigua]
MTSPGKQSQKRPPSPTPAARIRPRWNKWVKALSDLFPTSHTTTSSVVKPSTTSAVSNTSLCSSRSWEVASPNLSLPQSTERPVLAAAGDKISQQSEISGVKMFRETESRPLSQGQQNYQEQHSPKKYRVPPGTDATTTTPTAVSAAVVAAYTNKQTGNEQQQHQHQHQQHQQHQQLSSLPQLPREIFHQTPVMSAEDPQIPGHVAAVHQQLKGAEDDSNDNSSSINTTITTVITTASIGADYTPVAATETCSERPNMRQEQKVEGEGGTNQPFALTTRIATRRWLSRSLERIKSFRQLWARVRARQNRFGGSVITVFCMTAVVILVLC